MTQFTVLNKSQIIVPVRFARATTGYSLPGAPEVDDRGFKMGRRTDGWGATDARGPMVGLVSGVPVRIRVVREDIDDSAPLFVTAEQPDIIQILEPAGGALDEEGLFQVKATTSKGAPGRIQVRLGSATGPVLAELEPHVFSPLIIALTAHRVTIDSATDGGMTPQQPIERIARRVQAIWVPAGIIIRFDVTTRPIVDDSIQLGNVDTLNQPDADNWAEMRKVLSLQHARLGLPPGVRDKSVNWYIVQKFNNPRAAGFGVYKELADRKACDPGIITAALGADNDKDIERVARTVAHEIGHFFLLKHVQQRNSDNPVEDTYGRRQLMFPISWLPMSIPYASLGMTPRVDNVGYGDRARGCLITLKNHEHHSTDGETATARNAILSNKWY